MREDRSADRPLRQPAGGYGPGSGPEGDRWKESKSHVEGRQGLQVAIDGPAGAGKSTVALELARTLGYLYIDTGAMYRAMALKALRLGVDPSDARAMTDLAQRTEVTLKTARAGERPRVLLDGEDVTELIRRPEVNAVVSHVARIAGVRERLVALQQAMAQRGAVVMDGRDIGTVVLPSADVKVFLTASLSERARRRQAELRQAGHRLSLEQVEAELARRDELDSQREQSPLCQAPDAVLVDTTGKTVEQVVDEIVRLCREAAARKRGWVTHR